MSSAVGELDAALQAMLSLRPPGVSGTKINSITSLCIANIQSESVLVQKLYTHFKKAPGSHKLGVLYVVDSVTRQWVDHAKKAGQVPGPSASDGTYGAGVNRVTELLPVLMTDIIQHAPEDQKYVDLQLTLVPFDMQEKIKKLVDIWERSNTFPPSMTESFKEKLSAPRNAISTTPPGTPPVLPASQGQQPTTAAAAPAPNTSAILAALANMAKQNTAAPAPSNPPSQAPTAIVPNAHGPIPQQVSSAVNQAPAYPPHTEPVNLPLGGHNFANAYGQLGVNGNAAQSTPVPAPAPAQAPNPLAGLAAAVPQVNAGVPTDALQQQLALIQLLIQQGIPQEQWGPVIAALGGQGGAANNPGAAAASVMGNTGFNGLGAAGAPGGASAWPQSGARNAWDGRNDPQSRDRQGMSDRDQQGQFQRRDRSRSPGWGRNSPPPRKRDSPIYGEYNGGSPGRGSSRDAFDRRGRARGGRGGRGNEYRQRSPVAGRRSPDAYALPPPGARFIEFDSSIGKESIKGNRTLFVGGVTSSEADLRGIFSKFGIVQTCIVNVDKRHAFIKMINRTDAVKAKEGMETFRPPNMQLRTRWGVGFGPRDCSDYQTGISVIPIHRLTDADRKWMLTAEYGGTGGKPIEGGLVVEEPDIEIGAGVSSKAISRRMATDQGGKSGPRSTRTGPEPGATAGAASNGRFRRNERHDGPGPAPDSVNAIGVAPAVPGFGFQLGANGMPVFPTGFTFPAGLTQQQPPAPGQG
ncbi:MAG: hypothetical protein M1825_005462 [Sarcosagium campestre]|nr:MAG: hypothetical protein M1825_005462 [Sarcosagium campestre]